MVFENFQGEIIEALAIVDSNLLYVACLSDWKMHGEIKQCRASILLRSRHKLQYSLAKCLLHCLLKRKLSLKYQRRGFSRHFGPKSSYSPDRG